MGKKYKKKGEGKKDMGKNAMEMSIKERRESREI